MGTEYSLRGKTNGSASLSGKMDDGDSLSGQPIEKESLSGKTRGESSLEGEINYGGSGENGDSAYEIAVKNGFEGTEAEWLSSLKGKDGSTPYIIDGYWYVDGVNTQVKAEGVDRGDYILTEVDKQEIAAMIPTGHLATVDKVTYITAAESEKHNFVSQDESGIRWNDQYSFYDATQKKISEGGITQRVPIVAGENIEFEVDSDDNVVKIKADTLQPKNDSELDTTDKTIVGGINELNTKGNIILGYIAGNIWEIPEIPNYAKTNTLEFEFTSNGIAFRKLTFNFGGTGKRFIAYYTTDGSKTVYSQDTGWVDPAYRTMITENADIALDDYAIRIEKDVDEALATNSKTIIGAINELCRSQGVLFGYYNEDDKKWYEDINFSVPIVLPGGSFIDASIFNMTFDYTAKDVYFALSKVSLKEWFTPMDLYNGLKGLVDLIKETTDSTKEELNSIKNGDISNLNTVDKVTSIDTWAEGVYELDVSDGISWREGFSMMGDNSDTVASGEIYHRMPIIAGDNINFEPTEDGQYVRINATGGGTSSGDATVSDLTNTTWLLNETIDDTGYRIFYVDFISNGTNYTKFRLTYNGSQSYCTIQYDDETVYTSTNGWVDAKYRSITYRGGYAVTNEEWIGWNETYGRCLGNSLDMPQIRFANAIYADAEKIVSVNRPLKLTVEIVGGGALQVGDKLQICARRTYGYKNALDLSYRKQKLRCQQQYEITEEDLDKKFLTITTDGSVDRWLFKNDRKQSSAYFDCSSAFYMRIKRVTQYAGGKECDAIFSNIVTVWKTFNKETKVVNLK